MMPFVRRLCLMMCFVSLLNSSLLHAQQYQGLSETVKLPAGKQPVKEILKSLQQQGNYRYLYDPAQVESLSINIPKGTLSLSGLLQLLDQQLPLDVEVKDNIIAIRNEDRKATVASKVLTGTLQGKIFNDQNESIPGVTIFAGDNNHVTTSRVDGTYSLQLPEGTYNVRFSHLAFSQSSFNNVVVKAGKVTLKDVMLATSSSNLKGVTVSAAAKRETISALYNKQKNAAGLSDGISAEQIARTPDKNVGEVLKRISGVTTVDNKYVVVRGMSERYNAAMLNGQIMPSTELNRKNFSYDIIPSNIIDNITVYKTITPDMSAEFGGGLVNVETKAIPTENFFTISIGGSINDNTTGKAFNSLEIGGSEYLGKPSSHRDLFGKLNWKNLDDILANTNPGSTGTGHVLKDPASISNNWKVYQKNAHPSQNYQLSWGHVLNLGKGRQLGLIASASYRNTLQTQDIRMGEKDGYIYAPSLVTKKDSVLFKGKQYGFSTNTGFLAGIGYSAGKHKISLQSLYLNTLDQQLLMGKGVDGSGIGVPAPTIGFYDNVQWTKLWQTQLKGEHAVGGKGIKVQWSGTYVHLDRQRPDNHYLRSPAPDDSLTTSPIMMVGPPQSRGIDGAMRWWTRAYESDLNWDVNTVVPFRFNIGNAAVTNTFKAGYAGWYKDRSFYVARAGTGGYDSKIPQPMDYFFNPAHEGYTFAFDDFSDNFQRNATLHAAYGMFDHKLAGKLRLVWGVRAEYYDINRINEVLEKSIGEITDHEAYDLSSLYNREKNWNLFPSASLTYSLTPKMNFRATYAQSIIRPDLRELSFFSEYDFELGGEYNSTRPIVSSKLKHLDFRYEYYPGPGEILSLSLFYKKIDNPMEIYQANAVNEFTLLNNHQAENRGVEMEIRKSLSFIDVPVIRNLTLYGNGTRLFSRVRKAINPTYVEEPAGSKKMVLKQDIGDWEDRPQQGASNYMINGGVYYDVKFVSVSLLYNYVSNRLFMPNENSYMSLYERPVEALDGQIAFHLLKDKMLFRANVGNLLNSYSIIYKNAGDGDIGDGKKHPVKDMLYQEDKDILFYQAKPGRTYSFTLGYSF
ncbi:TonB-dependent Receptor Plug Domain [Chitinophaga ginsengisegetis]|uniref:TonB-dependent Receptor Plug Domain n=1 Tax=Chitinophaga ginsengisegetis TaxID=393003 RepID=A0A1T5P8Q4_9BACT|nr:TonB-dependent Receptor Plug Domain [Chitinophaga ginsengisegetis]